MFTTAALDIITIVRLLAQLWAAPFSWMWTMVTAPLSRKFIRRTNKFHSTLAWDSGPMHRWANSTQQRFKTNVTIKILI